MEVSSTLSEYLEQLRQRRTKVFQIATVTTLQIPWRNTRTQPQLCPMMQFCMVQKNVTFGDL